MSHEDIDFCCSQASIDEVYLDITAMVNLETQSLPGHAEGADVPDLQALTNGSVVVGGLALDPHSQVERRLAVGASIAARLRAAVYDQLGEGRGAIAIHQCLVVSAQAISLLECLTRSSAPAGFTCSAGVAVNKLLAKIGSALNKPNQQTVLLPRAVPDLLRDLPLKKIRNFGGKLGAHLEALGQVLALPPAVLERHFGDRAHWILQAVSGCSDIKRRMRLVLPCST